jgi:hypothetical protein
VTLQSERRCSELHRSWPKPGQVLPRRGVRGPGRDRCAEATPSETLGKPSAPRGYHRGVDERSDSPKRVFACTVTRWLPPTREPPKRIASARHAAGIRRQLPWGSDPLGVCTQAIVAPVYLTGTIRSRSFSLPQRFEPARASWLCFAPHPPTGFWPSELFPRSQPWHLSVLVALLSFRLAPVSLGQARAPPSPPTSSSPRDRTFHPLQSKGCSCRPADGFQHQLEARATEAAWRSSERPEPADRDVTMSAQSARRDLR